MQCLPVQSGSLTFGTDIGLGKLLRPFLSCSGSIFFLHHLYVLHYSFIRHKIVGGSMDEAAFYLNPLIGTIKNFINGFVCQVLDRCLYAEIIFFKQCFYLPEYHCIFILAQRCYGTFINRQFTIRNHFVYINKVDISQSFTSRTSSLRRIK